MTYHCIIFKVDLRALVSQPSTHINGFSQTLKRDAWEEERERDEPAGYMFPVFIIYLKYI